MAPKLVHPEEHVDQYLILAKDLTSLKAGGKSNNLNKIRGKIESWINLPEGMALQFNAAEEIIALPSNAEVKSKLDVRPPRIHPV